MRTLLYVFALTLVLGLPAAAKAALVVDLDQKQVAITTDFNGAELLLFGALNLNDGDDIVIVVSGPLKDVVLRRKSQVAGIWLNTESAKVTNIPSFYHIHSTRPLIEIAHINERRRIDLGYGFIPFVLDAGSRIDEGGTNEWKEALIRNMEASDLWKITNDRVSIRRNSLFRTNVVLPANIIPGRYDVRIIHIRDGALINEEKSSLLVAKKGLSAKIFEMAHEYPPFYGIFAIIFAIGAGWLAAVAFRR